MTVTPDVAALKRRARLLSKETGESHQRTLDAIAAEQGFAHWSALLAAVRVEGAAPADPAPTQPARTRTWRSDLLDRASGARAPVGDEAMVRIVGSIVRRAAGPRPMASLAAACAIAVALQILGGRLGSRPEWDSGDVFNSLFAVLAALVGHSLAFQKPDSLVLRSFRRRTFNAWAFFSLVAAASTLPILTGRVPTWPREAPLWPAAMACLALTLVVPMWIGTHAGRRSR